MINHLVLFVPLISGGQNLTTFTLQSSRSLFYFSRACVRFDCSGELDNCFASCLAIMLQEELTVYNRAITEETSVGSDVGLLKLLMFSERRR